MGCTGVLMERGSNESIYIWHNLEKNRTAARRCVSGQYDKMCQPTLATFPPWPQLCGHNMVHNINFYFCGHNMVHNINVYFCGHSGGHSLASAFFGESWEIPGQTSSMNREGRKKFVIAAWWLLKGSPGVGKQIFIFSVQCWFQEGSCS